jgi:hypothetical protein
MLIEQNIPAESPLYNMTGQSDLYFGDPANEGLFECDILGESEVEEDKKEEDFEEEEKSEPKGSLSPVSEEDWSISEGDGVGMDVEPGVGSGQHSE